MMLGSSAWRAMFASGLTRGIYSNFLREYRLSKSSLSNSPYVYVDLQTSNVKLLTNIIDKNTDEAPGFFALAVDNDGDIEVLTTEV